MEVIFFQAADILTLSEDAKNDIFKPKDSVSY